MNYEKEETWGTHPRRRTPAFARPEGHTLPIGHQAVPPEPYHLPPEASAHGPEAVARAREMDYNLTTRIQQESPYIREEVVEHKVHDYRLYVGMWVVAGLSGVAAFLTYNPVHFVITIVALVFALMSTPGRQRYED